VRRVMGLSRDHLQDTCVTGTPRKRVSSRLARPVIMAKPKRAVELVRNVGLFFRDAGISNSRARTIFAPLLHIQSTVKKLKE